MIKLLVLNRSVPISFNNINTCSYTFDTGPFCNLRHIDDLTYSIRSALLLAISFRSYTKACAMNNLRRAFQWNYYKA